MARRDPFSGSTFDAVTTIWEYEYVHTTTNDLGNMTYWRRQMGSLAWELVGWARTDRAVSINEFSAVFKREASGYRIPMI